MRLAAAATLIAADTITGARRVVGREPDRREAAGVEALLEREAAAGERVAALEHVGRASQGSGFPSF